MKILLLTFSLFLLSIGHCPAQELRAITVNDGLNSMIVRSITQDGQGLIWIATQWGVQSYNGSYFKSYDVYTMKGVTGTGDNRFLFIQYDKYGRLWAMNRNQLFLYNKELDNFSELFSIPDKKENFIEAMELHAADSLNIYVVTSNELYHYNIEQHKLSNVYDASGAHSFSLLDNGYALVATGNGLLYLNLSDDRVSDGIPPGCEYLNKLPKYPDLRKIKKDSTGNIWLATYTHGLYILTAGKEVVKPQWDSISRHYRILDLTDYNDRIAIAADGYGVLFCDPNFRHLSTLSANDNSFSLSNSGVQSLFVDNEERLWISTFGGGINCMDPNANPFRQIQHITNQPNSLSNDMVRAIYEDTQGNIWFGTKEGVSVYTPGTQQWKHLNSANNRKFTSNSTMAITEDADGNIWISTFAGGITICDKNLRVKQNLTTTNSQLKSDDIFVLFTDSQGDIWISGEDGSLCCYLHKEGHFVHYDINSRTRTITETRTGDILVSGIRGVKRIDKKNRTIEDIFTPKNQKKHIMVYSVLEDAQGQYWFATDGMGVICTDRNQKILKQFTIDGGLTSNVCYCLLSDKAGNIWVSTQMGLNCINSKDFSIQSYSAKSSVHGQLREFLYCSKATLENGQLLFGGFNGCIIFDPAKVNSEPKTYPLLFTDFKLFNHSVIPQAKSSILQKNIDQTERITLDYTQNSFSIDFVAINFSKVEQNRYSWMLEGADKEWNAYTDRSTAYYTNLATGTYKFRVRNTPADENPNERSLVIVIRPPWWLSPTAYCIYILVALTAISFLIRYYKNKITAIQAREKTNFFIHIAHDLKTPLSLIMLPLSTIRGFGELSEKADRELDIAIKNAERLKQLINQLLQFEKASSQMVKLQVGKYRAEATIGSIVKAFTPVLEKKKIELSLLLPELTTWLWFDMDKFEKIIYNLMDNAVKYTPEGGRITIRARIDTDHYRIEIEDSGIGITDNQKASLFKKYFRASNAVNSKIPGSGVGLLIVKELIKLHCGTISFSSSEGKGSIFVLTLPLGKKHFVHQPGIGYVEQTPASAPTQEESLSGKSKVLIVEDNPELMVYMKRSLEEYYEVGTATDGVEAMEQMQASIPDIVITDYMMPRMDGIELCKAIRNNQAWQAIPVIMLTALSSNDHKIDGFNAGADAYIEKPFDILVVQSCLRNLLKSRNLFKKNALKLFDQDRYPADEENQLFLNRLNEVIMEHLSDTEFSIDVLCDTFGMSHSTLYRKMKEVSNQSPVEYINEVRMRKAAELLKTGKYNVSEVAYMTGFSFPNYFSKVFKRFFGCTPNELLPR